MPYWTGTTIPKRRLPPERERYLAALGAETDLERKKAMIARRRPERQLEEKEFRAGLLAQEVAGQEAAARNNARIAVLDRQAQQQRQQLDLAVGGALERMEPGALRAERIRAATPPPIGPVRSFGNQPGQLMGMGPGGIGPPQIVPPEPAPPPPREGQLVDPETGRPYTPYRPELMEEIANKARRKQVARALQGQATEAFVKRYETQGAPPANMPPVPVPAASVAGPAPSATPLLVSPGILPAIHGNLMPRAAEEIVAQRGTPEAQEALMGLPMAFTVDGTTFSPPPLTALQRLRMGETAEQIGPEIVRRARAGEDVTISPGREAALAQAREPGALSRARFAALRGEEAASQAEMADIPVQARIRQTEAQAAQAGADLATGLAAAAKADPQLLRQLAGLAEADPMTKVRGLAEVAASYPEGSIEQQALKRAMVEAAGFKYETVLRDPTFVEILRSPLSALLAWLFTAGPKVREVHVTQSPVPSAGTR